MKALKVSTENQEAIEAALKAENGRAKTHTFSTFEEVQEVANAVENELNELDLPKTYRPGAKVVVRSKNYLPRSHRGAWATELTLVRKTTGWFVKHIEPLFVGGGPSHDGNKKRYTFTNKQLAKIGEMQAKNATGGSVYKAAA